MSCLHQNGLGQTYSDCANPLGSPGVAATYNLTMAQEAAMAWDPSEQPQLFTCGTHSAGNFSDVVVVQSVTRAMAATWAYSGTSAGYVLVNPFSASTFVCPSSGDSTWN